MAAPIGAVAVGPLAAQVGATTRRSARPIGGNIGAIGDSQVATVAGGPSTLSRAALRSARYRVAANLAVPGTRTDEILTTLSTLLSLQPDAVLFNGGTNDFGQSLPNPIRANLHEIASRIRGAGIPAVYQSLYPHGTNATRRVQYDEHNKWAAIYCRKYGVAFVDAWSKFAKPDGSWRDGYMYVDSANVHANVRAEDVLADLLTYNFDHLQNIPPLLAQRDSAQLATNIFANEVSWSGVTNGVNDGLPTGYTKHGTGATYSVTAPDADATAYDTGLALGGWLRSSFAGASASSGFLATRRTLDQLGWQVGDRIAFGCKLRWNTTGEGTLLPSIAWIGESGGAVDGLTTAPIVNNMKLYGNQALTIYGESTVTAGTGASYLNLRFSAVTTEAGYMEVSRPTVFNLSAADRAYASYSDAEAAAGRVRPRALVLAA